MFGIFKNRNSFKSLLEFSKYCENELDQTAIRSYKSIPNAAKGGPLDALFIMEGFNRCLKDLESRVPDIAHRNKWSIHEVESTLYNTYEKVNKKYISY